MFYHCMPWIDDSWYKNIMIKLENGIKIIEIMFVYLLIGS